MAGRTDATDEPDLKCRRWLERHPEALEDIATAFVREHPASRTFVKRTSGGEVEISKDEFEARQWVLTHPDVLAKVRGVAT
jgi:hypothetical protein